VDFCIFFYGNFIIGYLGDSIEGNSDEICWKFGGFVIIYIFN
jgi:hypothetical protein